MIRKVSITLILLTVLAAAVVPAFAQEHTRTYTKTEAQINQSYAVTNPWRRTLSDVHVDLQDGQAVISATYTRRRTEAIAVSSTVVPSLENGRLYWTVTTVSANGAPVSDELLAQINAQITTSWVNYWKRNAAVGHITGVQITEDSISVTVAW